METQRTQREEREYLEGELTENIIGAALEVHKRLGPGLLESVYQSCLMIELEERKLEFKRELSIPIIYKGRKIENGFRLDFMVENKVIVELKSVESLLPIYESQVLTYLRLLEKRVGLLINFNVGKLKQGVRRLVL